MRRHCNSIQICGSFCYSIVATTKQCGDFLDTMAVLYLTDRPWLQSHTCWVRKVWARPVLPWRYIWSSLTHWNPSFDQWRTKDPDREEPSSRSNTKASILPNATWSGDNTYQRPPWDGPSFPGLALTTHSLSVVSLLAPAAVIQVCKLPVGFLLCPNTSHPTPAFQGLDQLLSRLVCDALQLQNLKQCPSGQWWWPNNSLHLNAQKPGCTSL